VHAYVLRNRLAFMLAQGGALPWADAVARMNETNAMARKVAPQDPLVRVVEAVHLYYTPPGDRDGGRGLLRRSIETLEAHTGDPHAALWVPILWGWYGVTWLGEGDAEKAREAFEMALKIRADYAFARTALLPMTDLAEPVRPPAMDAAGWKAVLSDAEGDGRNAALPDLRGVSWQLDPAADRIWFRLDLAAPLDPARAGVNLAFDVDDDQKTGNGWWAGNTSFKYDRLVTVWVARGRDGHYRGSVGTADASDVSGGRMVSSPPGTVAFALEPQAILVAVPRQVVGDRVHLVATVGSNIDWNDVAPSQGSTLLVTGSGRNSKPKSTN
jgi:hypothetical protein